jgi:benzoyl-CoA reductase/2-hydroxyglutaryl-CoA dehydratase subunit BcrC/BadD/HgdB
VVRYIAAQLQDLAGVLAPLAPIALDVAELEHRVALSREACRLWARCLEASASVPAPWTFFDQVIHMAPIVVLRGAEEAVSYYRDLAAELERRCEQRRGAVSPERYRIYWEGMPIWGRLRPLSELFSAAGAALVASTYCNSWILEFPEGDPWEGMAATYLNIFICRSEEFKEDYIAEVCRSFGCSGVVFHDSRTCPHNTNSRYGMPRRLKERSRLATLVLEGDLNDPRCFAVEEARVRIEAFLEELETAEVRI